MAIQDDKDYLFIPAGYLSEGKVTGLTNSEVCMVGTPDYLFFLPERSITSFAVLTKIKTYNFGDRKPSEAVAELLNDPELTVQELEDSLKEMLGPEADKRIYKISELEKFKIVTGLFAQNRIKKSGQAIRVYSPKKKADKRRFIAYYKK